MRDSVITKYPMVIDGHTYTIKSYKECRGHDGPAWSANLFVDGTKTALINDDSYGGGLRWEWVGGENHFYGTSPTAVIWKDFVNSLGSWTSDDLKNKDGTPFSHKYDDDVAFEEILNIMLQHKDFTKWCKKSVCFRLKGDDADKYRQIGMKSKCVLTLDQVNQLRAYIAKKHGDKVIEILNSRFGVGATA